MMRKSVVFFLMAAVVLVISGDIRAQSIGTIFTYQGKLSDGGSPANGQYDFEFKLFDAETLGSQIGQTNIKQDVGVYEGYFTTSLDFGGGAFNGEERWLQIGVRPGASGDSFTTLNPRRLVTGTPYALQMRGIYISEANDVGVGTFYPSAKLDVHSGANTAVYGRNQVYDNYGYLGGSEFGVSGRVSSSYGAGVYGHSANPDSVGVHGSGGFGNYGYLGTVNYGVYGRHYNSGNEGHIAGDSYGVYGSSGSGVAGYFTSSLGYGLVVENGNVGIGTTNPTAKLEVAGATDTDESVVSIINQATGFGGSALQISGAGATATGVDGININTVDGDGISMTSVTGYGYRIAGGYVGFRSHSPSQYGLEVYNSGNHGINISGVDGDGIHVDSAGGWAGYFNGDGYFSGNLGVGKINPVAKLDVYGDVNANYYEISGQKVLTSPGLGNTFLGQGAGAFTASYGENNTFLGAGAGFRNDQGLRNTYIGKDAGFSGSVVSSNTCVGYMAGYKNEEGDNNTSLGYQAGYSNVNGQNNIFIGYEAGFSETGSDRLYIANGRNDSDILIYGDFSSNRLGLGTTSPASELHVNGAIRLGSGSRDFEIREVTTSDPAGWSSYINYDGIGIGSNTGTNHQMFLFTDGSNDQNIFTVATSQNNSYTWEADFVIQQDGNVGIGTTDPGAKLEVNGNMVAKTASTSGTAVTGRATASGDGVANKGGYFEASGGNGKGVVGVANCFGDYINYGGHFSALGNLGVGVYGNGYSKGVSGKCNGGEGVYGETVDGYGVYGYASGYGDVTNYGGYFKAQGKYAYGVYGYASHTEDQNYGGYFEADGANGYGVYGKSNGSDGVGVYGHATGSSSTAIEGNGQIYDFYASGPGVNYGVPSSIRWKKNIKEIADPLGKVQKLRGVYYEWDAEHGGRSDVGMIAEEVGKVLPEIVVYEENGIDASGMDYGKIAPLLVEAVKSLKQENDTLKIRLEQLEAEFHRLESQVNGDQKKIEKLH